MTTNIYQFRSLLVSALLMLAMTSSLLHADDTEIYTGASLSGTNLPNLVFLIDTSGSMSTSIDSSDKETYNPSKTYYGYCTAGRYYYASGTNLPDCRKNGADRYYVEPAVFHCNSAAANLADGGSGSYYDLYARGSISSWDESLSSTDHTSPIECQDDNGIHGDKDAADPSLAPYPKVGGGWSSTSSSGISWGSKSYNSSYTFYNANYVNWAKMDRLSLVKNVYVDLMNTIAASGASVNMALMRYDNGSDDGGYFITPMQELTPANVDTFNDAVLALMPNGYTPLSESLYEIYLYYAGKTSAYGHNSQPGQNPAGVYVDGNTTNHVYKSPIVNQCQKSFAILLTDGAPTHDIGADDAIKALTGISCHNSDGDCMDELAGYMSNNDCATPSPTLDQNVITYTIGFGTSANALAILQDTADAGKGEYFPATSAQDLQDALAKIIVQVKKINTTFTAPAVSINAYNRNFHNDELYYALFRPEDGPAWPGNIKVYKLSKGELIDKNNKPAIDPATGFTYSNTLDFWSNATDFPDGNGGNVELGGAAYKLDVSRNLYTYTNDAAPNNVDLTSGANILSETNSTNITKTMLGDSTMTDTEYDNFMKWARGLDMKDVDGDGVTNLESRKSFGDPLHSQPVVINYGPGTDDLTLFFGTNEGFLHALSIKDKGTEQFAFMPKELLGNIRKRYLGATLSYHLYGLDGPLTYWHNDLNNNGNLYSLIDDGSGSGTTIASLDSTGGVDEHAYLYVGMRRGNSSESPYYVDAYHNSYYALDVTDIDTPKLLWQITGGSGTYSTTGFDELAQTWSAMKHAVVEIGTTATDVLIFGGGYDAENSDQKDNTHTADNKGRAIYMVNASTGAIIWQAGPTGTAAGSDPDLVLSEMTNSIPGDIVIFDTNHDGFADRMYASDTGGQIWRFDINNGKTNMGEFVTGGVIAKLYGTTKEENRRFYYAPAVALSKDRSYLAIAIGSGQRANPVNTTVQDAFFVIKDPYVYTAPPADASGKPNYKYVNSIIATSDPTDIVGDAVITVGATFTIDGTDYPQLYDATSNILGAVDGGKLADGSTTVTKVEIDAAKVEAAEAYGWYIKLHDYDANHAPLYLGEKVTADATIINNTVSFVTYTPVETTSGTDICKGSQGRGLIYTVSLVDGSPVFDNNGDTTVDYKDRVREKTYGIPGKVQNVIEENGWMDCSGMKCYDGGSLTPDKLQWQME